METVATTRGLDDYKEDNGMQANPKQLKILNVGLLGVLATLCLCGCMTSSERLVSVAEQGDERTVAMILARGGISEKDLIRALKRAVVSKNADAARAILEHLHGTQNSGLLQDIPQHYVLEYDPDFTSERDRAGHRTEGIIGDRFSIRVPEGLYAHVCSDEQIRRIEANRGRYPRLKDGNPIAATYYTRVLRNDPGLLGIAIANADEVIARLLIDAGVPCRYEFCEDASPCTIDLYAYNWAPDSGIMSCEYPGGVTQMTVSGRFVTDNFPGSRQMGVLYRMKTHAQIAREKGMDGLADFIEGRSQSRQER